MSNKTRKRIWPVSLVAAIGVVAMVAALAVVALTPNAAQAQAPFAPPGNLQTTVVSDTEISLSWDAGLGETSYDVQRVEGVDPAGFATIASGVTERSYTDSGLTANTEYSYRVRGVNSVGGSMWSNTATATTMMAGMPPGEPMMGDVIVESSSTSASATVELKLTIKLTENVPVGGALVLYLEDDFQEPDSISASDVYFVSMPAKLVTGNGSRVYATVNPEIDTDDHFTADKKDIDIRVSVPDMCANNEAECEGANGLMSGDTVTMVIQKSGGIKNPSEAGTHSVGASVLGPVEGVGAPMYRTDKVYAKDSQPAAMAQEKNNKVILGMRPDTPHAESADVGLKTLAKISLSDVDNSRGYEMTVTGSGFNNGTSAGVYVYHTTGGMPTCRMIIEMGTNVGDAIVSSDDKAIVTFEVTAPTFGPGNTNYICMVDGEGRMSDTDVEDFKLEPSIKVVPSSVNSGDTVNVFAQDFPAGTGGFVELKIGGMRLWEVVDTDDTPNVVDVSPSSIRTDGSGEVTFEVPGGLEGVLRIDAKWGSVNEDSKITIAGGDLSVSKTDALPNDTITITGNGFGSQTCIPAANFRLDNTPVLVDEESISSSGGCSGSSGVEVSNSGQFVATIVLWPAGSGSNPTLIPGVHELSVEDDNGFGSEVNITIPEPSVSVTPAVAGPRDYITIVGENWPVDNPENPTTVSIEIEVDDNPGASRARTYILFADAAGRVMQEHRVHRNVAIPSTVQVKITHAEVAEIGSFSVPASTIEVTPGEGQPGDMISLTAGNMPVYSEVDYVEVGGTRSNDPGVNTDRDGNVTVDDVLIPGLDPGLYSVVINVKGTIAIGEVNVLPEGVAGAATALPDAVADFGDNLDAIFHFDNNSKEWSFYDPRPEFAELNTLTELNRGQPYWVLVKADQERVNWNNRLVDFTCAGGDCWNLEIW